MRSNVVCGLAREPISLKLDCDLVSSAVFYILIPVVLIEGILAMHS